MTEGAPEQAGESPNTSRPDFRKILNVVIDEQRQHVVNMEMWRKKNGGDEEKKKREDIERLRGLTFEEIHIDRTQRPEIALQEIGSIYDARTVEDDALRDLVYGDLENFQANVHDGMLHRFRPSPEELKCYPPGYESVCMQMFRDAGKESDRPGEYRLFGLRNSREEGNPLKAWASFRLPSSDPARMGAFARYLDDLFFSENHRVHLEGDIQQVLRKANYQLIEFDTACVSKGWEATGTMLLFNALKEFTLERGEANMPKGIFFYRFGRLKVLSANNAEDFESGLSGENNSTTKFRNATGFSDIGYRQDSKERIVRSMDGFEQPVEFSPLWRYSSQKVSIVMNRCAVRLKQFGVLP